jgi:inositol oxygenase
VEFPNVDHGFQTAEGIRAAGYPEWMILVGLVHDVGKMQFLWGGKEEGMEGTPTGHQWSLGGDTWVVGCAIPESVVFPEFNKLNPDMNDARYNTEHGIYEPGCGIRNLKIAWGHDEYAYMVVKNHTDKMRAKGAKEEDLIPEEGLSMIRYHSCYPWHNKGEYEWAYAPGDEEIKAAVLRFNRFDLYTKAEQRPDIPKLWPYYQTLIDRFLPGKISW